MNQSDDQMTKTLNRLSDNAKNAAWKILQLIAKHEAGGFYGNDRDHVR